MKNYSLLALLGVVAWTTACATGVKVQDTRSPTEYDPIQYFRKHEDEQWSFRDIADLSTYQCGKAFDGTIGEWFPEGHLSESGKKEVPLNEASPDHRKFCYQIASAIAPSSYPQYPAYVAGVDQETTSGRNILSLISSACDKARQKMIKSPFSKSNDLNNICRQIVSALCGSDRGCA